jgi:D-alanyl-D-alanine carboxypeptidase
VPQPGDGDHWPTTDDDKPVEKPSAPVKDAETHELPVPDQPEKPAPSGWFDPPAGDESAAGSDKAHAKPAQQRTQPVSWPVADLERQAAKASEGKNGGSQPVKEAAASEEADPEKTVFVRPVQLTPQGEKPAEPAPTQPPTAPSEPSAKTPEQPANPQGGPGKTPDPSAEAPALSAKTPEPPAGTSERSAQAPAPSAETPEPPAGTSEWLAQAPAPSMETPGRPASTSDPSAQAPASSAETPGQPANTPEQAANAPSAEAPPPSAATPGRSPNTPDPSAQAPAHAVEAPGQSVNTSEQAAEARSAETGASSAGTPGWSANTPALSAEAPGQSAEAPSAVTPAPSAETPGRSPNTPYPSAQVPSAEAPNPSSKTPESPAEALANPQGRSPKTPGPPAETPSAQTPASLANTSDPSVEAPNPSAEALESSAEQTAGKAPSDPAVQQEAAPAQSSTQEATPAAPQEAAPSEKASEQQATESFATPSVPQATESEPPAPKASTEPTTTGGWPAEPKKESAKAGPIEPEQSESELPKRLAKPKPEQPTWPTDAEKVTPSGGDRGWFTSTPPTDSKTVNLFTPPAEPPKPAKESATVHLYQPPLQQDRPKDDPPSFIRPRAAESTKFIPRPPQQDRPPQDRLQQDRQDGLQQDRSPQDRLHQDRSTQDPLHQDPQSRLQQARPPQDRLHQDRPPQDRPLQDRPQPDRSAERTQVFSVDRLTPPADRQRQQEWPPPEPPRAAPQRVGPPPPEPPTARKSKKPLLITAIAIVAVIGIAAGVVFGVPGLAAKLGLASDDSVAIAPPPAPVSYSPDLHAPDTAAPMPSAQGVQSALAGPIANPALGTVTGVVVDPATGQTLYERDAGEKITPASTGKLITAAAALLTLDHTEQLVTKVVQGDQPGEVIIVGGGDPTISSLKPGNESIYPGAAHLSDLVDQVKNSGVQVSTVYIDQSRYTGPKLAQSWLPEDVSNGYIAPIVPAMLDGDRRDATTNYSPRTNDPGRTLVDEFARRIGASPAGDIEKKAPANAKVLGEIRSAPVSQLVDNMLDRSENTLGDIFAREVAIRTGQEPSFDGATKAMLDVLRQNNFDVDGVVLKDGSGMSTENKVSAKLLAQILAVAAGPDGKDGRTAKLRPLLSGLPVAGGSGTLEGRYTDGASSAGKGWVRAKTGTLTGVNSLAGIVMDKDNRPLVFAFLTNGTNGSTARPALDAVAAALRGCGCQ